MKLPSPQMPYRSSTRNRVKDAAFVLAALAFAVFCDYAMGQENCRIDPRTGQRICPQQFLPPQQFQPPQAHCRVFVAGDGSAGSGTLVAKDASGGTVLTCWHLFRDSTRGVTVSFTDGTSYPARIIALDPPNDLAALAIAPPRAAPIAVDVADPSGQVWCCGFGGQMGLKCAPGPVTRRTGVNGAMDYNTVIYASIRMGDSGGGILDGRGRFRGVISAYDHEGCYAICGRPLARFLDRVWPNRPGRIIPHAQRVPIAANQTPPTAASPANDPAVRRVLDQLAEQQDANGWGPANLPPAPQTQQPLPANIQQPVYTAPQTAAQAPAPVSPSAPPAPASSGPTAFEGFVAGVAGVPWWKLITGGLAVGGGAIAIPAAARWFGGMAVGYYARRKAKSAFDDFWHPDPKAPPATAPSSRGKFVDVENYTAAEENAIRQLRQTRPGAVPLINSFRKFREVHFVPYETDSLAAADERAQRAFADKFPGAVALLETFKGMRDLYLKAS